jgi:hypothetical protein
MEKSSSIFIKIDEFIFSKLDILKSDGTFQKFNDMLSSIDESNQKMIAQITTFFFLLAPFFVVLFLWWGNSQTKKSLEIKKQIIEQISIFEGNQNALNNVSANYLSPTAIMGQEDLDNKIRNILSQHGIDQQKVAVSNFHQASTSSNVAKIEADVSFKSFGTNDFSNFMRSMIETERFKVLKVELMKDKASNLLQGTISLMHMGQSPMMPGQ